jgi:hypothetical protein
MSVVEYVYASHIELAEAFARGQKWRPVGRAKWLKDDGTSVHFISLPPQLRTVARGETVYVLGRSKEAFRILARQRAIAVRSRHSMKN